MPQLYTNLEDPATSLAYEQKALSTFTSHQISSQAQKVDRKGQRGRKLGHVEKSDRGA